MNVSKYIKESVESIFKYDCAEFKLILSTTVIYLIVSISYPGYIIAFQLSEPGERFWGNIAHIFFKLIEIYIISIYTSHIVLRYSESGYRIKTFFSRLISKNTMIIFIFLTGIYILYLALFWSYHLKYNSELNLYISSLKIITFIIVVSYISQFFIKIISKEKIYNNNIRCILFFLVIFTLPAIFIWMAIDSYIGRIYFSDYQFMNYVKAWSMPIVNFLLTLFCAKTLVIAALIQHKSNLQH